MVSHLTQAIRFAPLIIYSFSLLAPHHLRDAMRMNLEVPDPAKLTTTADKLRWYRYRKALLQRDVADYARIDRKTYTHYEEGVKDYYPVDKLCRIAEVLEVAPEELMDAYTLFLYHGQGQQIKEKREALGMTVMEYAEHLGVQQDKVRKWESGKVRVSREMWGRYFK